MLVNSQTRYFTSGPLCVHLVTNCTSLLECLGSGESLTIPALKCQASTGIRPRAQITYIECSEGSFVASQNGLEYVVSGPFTTTILHDLYYLVHLVFVRLFAEIGLHVLHGVAIEKGGKGIVLLGEPGSGKTVSGLRLVMSNQFRLAATNRVLLEVPTGDGKNRVKIVGGSVYARLRPRALLATQPELARRLEISPDTFDWSDKLSFSPQQLRLAGVEFCQEAVVVLIAHLDIGIGNRFSRNAAAMKRDDDLPVVYGFLSEYIRAHKNLLISLKLPLPSLDLPHLAEQRVIIADTLLAETSCVRIIGDIEYAQEQLLRYFHEASC